MSTSDLPFGSEFSPSQINLPELLELAKKYSSNVATFVDAIKNKYFASHKTDERNKIKLAGNTRLGMIAYGILDRETNQLTPFGERLYSIRTNESQLYEEFAKHILVNLNGMTLIQCIQDMQTAGESVTLENLRQQLAQRGIHFPRGGKHPSMMRLWLEKAGVFTKGWRVNETRVQYLLGISKDDLEGLSHFTREQIFYLKALANMGGSGPYRSIDVQNLAYNIYGVRYSEKGVARQVLYPLRDAGYINLKFQGSKTQLVEPTTKFRTDIIEPLLDQVERQVGKEIGRLLQKSFSDILSEVRDPDKNVRGLALEALAFKLMMLIDLTYVATRLRGSSTGGAEVDLIFESSRLVFSRWQVQCKNTHRFALDDVAKEVGLTHMLKSNVIVIVSTSDIGSEARKYANKIMRDSNLCIVMIDRDDIQEIEKNPASIISILNRQAKQTMKLKALNINGNARP